MKRKKGKKIDLPERGFEPRISEYNSRPQFEFWRWLNQIKASKLKFLDLNAVFLGLFVFIAQNNIRKYILTGNMYLHENLNATSHRICPYCVW